MGAGSDSWEGTDDTQTEDVGLPEHEDDTRAGTDTATGEQNP